MQRGDHLGAGRYRVLDELGRGGMGVVWLAEDLTIGRRVAVKELHLPQGIAPQERQVFEERVLREARTAGRLSDPGIVTVHDVVREHGSTFIVMELIEAPNLAEVVEQHGPMPVEQVLTIAEQVLSALETAHAAGIVHRDVKPSNVMVAPNGRVKLTDFGIAQSIGDSKLTQSGTLIGSPTYISPERLLGQDASPASDLWALGATLFYAAEGFGAYDRPSTPASIQAIMNERAVVRRAHGPLADLIMGLLDPDPLTRLTGGQVRYLIDQVRQRTSAAPQLVVPQHAGAQLAGSHRETTKQLPRKSRGLVVAVAVIALLSVVGGILLFTGVIGPSKNTASGSSSGTSEEQKPAEPGTSEAKDEPADQTTSKTKETAVDAPAQSRPKAFQKTRTYGHDGEITNATVVEYGEKGSCYNGLDLNEPLLDCADAHDTEIFGQIQLNYDSGDYPGQDKLLKESEDGCVGAFGELKADNKDTTFKFWTLVPTKTAWEDSRRRKALCVVAKADGGKLTGTVAGK
nr:serine/threonine-protein kinase [Kibdelosporangium sp. MJ126-NF4]CEL16833.1 serine/threonine protein kinase [Kibdelosporangium sp. MJ126-NF4]CTQ91939.1 serine/threonine protein kinase [Kibdelosporangium sp. MJ126-NF4]